MEDGIGGKVFGAETGETVDMLVDQTGNNIGPARVDDAVIGGKMSLKEASFRENIDDGVSLDENGALRHLSISGHDGGVVNTDGWHRTPGSFLECMVIIEFRQIKSTTSRPAERDETRKRINNLAASRGIVGSTRYWIKCGFHTILLFL